MARRHPSERMQFAILLERLQSQLQVVAEGHSGLKDQLTVLDQKITALDHKVTALDHKVTVLDQKITALDQRVGRLEQRFDEHLSAHAA